MGFQTVCDAGYIETVCDAGYAEIVYDPGRVVPPLGELDSRLGRSHGKGRGGKNGLLFF